MKPIRSLLILALFGAAFLVNGPEPRAAAQAPKPTAGAKNIDLVICLDISGSMSGLVNSARVKLWDVVNELARVKPAPNLRVALYSYGGTAQNGYDARLGWVRKDLDLTHDLDALYEKLFALKIGGGREYVTRVCRDAVEQLKWSEDKDALKIIFVCGNEPASQDRQVSLKEAADKAKARGILINPIFCGNAQHRDARDWVEFAQLCGGRFASIDQDRGTVAIATPVDKQLIELGDKMSRTYVAYGRHGKESAANQRAQDSNAARLGTAPAAARAATKTSVLYRTDHWDLVDRVKRDPKFDVKKLAEAELPDEMRKMTPEQRVAHVKQMASERAALQKQIDELNAKRTAYIREELARQRTQGARTLDTAIRETLRIQAATKGIQIGE